MSNATPPSRVVSSGDESRFVEAELCNVAQGIAKRISARPNGIIRSFADDSAHRTENYISLWRRAGDIAAALTSIGATPSCQVIILVEDIVDFLPAFWACLRGGFIAVALTNVAKDFLFRDDTAFGAAVGLFDNPFFLTDDFFSGQTKLSRAFARPLVPLSSVRPTQSWTDYNGVSNPACLVATSGSTGTVKLVALSHAAMIFRSRLGSHRDSSESWHGIGTFPLDGVTGQFAIYLPYDSWTQISAQTITRDPCAVLDAIEALGGNALSLTSSMIGQILAADERGKRSRQLGSLKFVGVGAEPIAIKLMQRFSELLCRYGASPDILTSAYGTTETGALVLGSQNFLDAKPNDAVCLGRPADGVDIRIVNDQGAVIDQGHIGELEAYCPQKIFSGYWGDAKLTRDAFTADGWWKTKDLGRIVDGQLFLHGRVKDVLIVGGKKFSLVDIDAELRDALSSGDAGYGCVVVADGQEALGVVFAVADISSAAGVSQTIKEALARRFGIQPSRLVRVDAGQIPKTASGKIRRHLLGALLVCNPEKHADPEWKNDRSELARIWNIALGRDGPVSADADFFAQGGDSLRSLTMHLQIVDNFGVNIPSDLFFTRPTFANLLDLIRVDSAASRDPAREADIPWRLPVGLETRLLAALETWPGDRPTPGRTMLSFNAEGTNLPIFWVFNDHEEPVALAAQLARDQPLYAFRSGVAVSDYDEDDIQALALRYLADITAVHPAGAFFIGGNCQGAIIALAIGQHALRRKRHVPLLVLMDWAFALQPYLGPVLLIAGRDNANHNAMRLFAKPEMAWKRAFASHEFVEIPGGYADGLKPGAIEVLAECLVSRMQLALQNPLPLMPSSGYHANLLVYDVPETMQAGAKATITAVVTNESDVSWGATDQSGIVLGCRWLDATDQIVRTAASTTDLPAIAPRASATVDLTIIAPDITGEFKLNIELCEEGSRWFAAAQSGFRATLRIVAMQMPPTIQ